MRKILVLVALSLSPCLWAFSNAYVTFDHPEGWVCERVQGVWICQASQDPDRRESVVLSIATMATEWDTVENYEDWLKQQRTVQDDQSQTFTSEVRYVRKRNINGHTWIDSLQYNSELPGFWARYVAPVHQTPKAKLAVLITYIVSNENYKKLAPQFERMVSSLKLNATFDINVATRQGDAPLSSAEKLGPLQKNLLADRLAKKAEVKPAETSSGLGTTMLLLVGIGAVAYFIVKKRKAKKLSAKGGAPTPPVKKTGT